MNETKRSPREIMDKIFCNLTIGEISVDEANQQMKINGIGLDLNPTKHMFTPKELLEAVGGDQPDGMGLMDDGIGVYKARVIQGKLEFKAFELPAGWSSEGWNPGNHYFHIAGEKYWVEHDGETLVHYAGQDNQLYTPPAQDGPDTRKRPDLAGQMGVPNGKYLSDYNQFGYHIRSVLASAEKD